MPALDCKAGIVGIHRVKAEGVPALAPVARQRRNVVVNLDRFHHYRSGAADAAGDTADGHVSARAAPSARCAQHYFPAVSVVTALHIDRAALRQVERSLGGTDLHIAAALATAVETASSFPPANTVTSFFA